MGAADDRVIVLIIMDTQSKIKIYKIGDLPHD